VRNDIFVTPNPGAPQGSTIEGYFINLDRTRRQGIEASSRFFLSGGHSIYANYTYTMATFESTADIFSPIEDPALGISNTVHPGNRLPLVPEQQFKAGVDLRLGSHLGVGAGGRYIGKQWLRGDEANQTPELPDYFVADARAAVTFSNWEVVGIVTNLFDKKYANFGTFNFNEGVSPSPLERFLTPGQKRAFRIVVRRSFGGGSHPGGIDAD
jgi:outer membrane receptor protein involved in Fe transport